MACRRSWVQPPSAPLIVLNAGVAEWYTRRSQKPMFARACGFDSHLQHNFPPKSFRYRKPLITTWLTIFYLPINMGRIKVSHADKDRSFP